MSRLNKVIRQSEMAADPKKHKKKKEKRTAVPVYDMSGHAISPEKKRRQARLLTFILIVALIAGFIYLPQFILKGDQQANGSLSADASAIRMANNALRDNPNADFDGDGLSNSEETSFKSNPWWIDTDGDGATDYCEAHVTNTNPTTPDNLLEDAQTKQDKQKEKNVGSPYKINNVILWADDYESKSHGSVVQTPTGYRFCNFNGYAQFTAQPDGFAYKVEDGVRTLLPYRDTENVWKVSDGDMVELYDKELKEIVEISFFNHPFYVSSNKVTDALAKVFPDRGFITVTKKMSVDVEPDTSESIIADIEKPAFDSSDTTRFTVNSNTLNDLLYVRETISENNGCVAVSLYSPDKGEAVAIIYGYTHDGDLLLADLNTLEPIGTLEITEKAEKIMDETGALVSYSYFDFSGFGFNSENGDRISFFASSSDADFQSHFGTTAKVPTPDAAQAAPTAEESDVAPEDETAESQTQAQADTAPVSITTGDEKADEDTQTIKADSAENAKDDKKKDAESDKTADSQNAADNPDDQTTQDQTAGNQTSEDNTTADQAQNP